MNKKFLLIFIRYLSLLMMSINLLTLGNEISNYLFILLMLFIINNQLRFFNLKNQTNINISILIEFLLIFVLYSNSNLINPFLFIPIILDISFFKDNKLKYGFFSFIIVILFLSISSISFYNFMQYSITCLVIFILCLYIHNQELDSLNYQAMYDKLRITEDKLTKTNQDLEVHISSIEDVAILKERNRISREIHDSVGHALSTTLIQLSALKRLSKNNPDLHELISDLREFVNESFQEVRKVVSDLKPVEYENYKNLFKIEELIKNFVKLTNVDTKLSISKNTWYLPSDLSIGLYRIIQESLSNSLRHGKATKIDVFLSFNIDSLILTIKDNGSGCKNIKKGNGLNSISERVSELNGKVEFTNSSDGFITRAYFPRILGGKNIE